MSVHCLENERCAIAISDRGVIVSLRNLQTGTEYVTLPPASGWKAITTLGGWFEHPVMDRDNRGRLEAGPGELRVTFDKLVGAEGARMPVGLTFRYQLRAGSDEIVTTYEVENRSQETVNEIWFPFLSGLHRIRPGEQEALAVPRWIGRRIPEPTLNLPLELLPYWPKFSGYGIEYPGQGSMSWMDFYTPSEGLYLGNHDPSIPRMTHLLRRRAEGGFEMGFATYPFVRPGQTYTSAPIVLSPHVDDWHAGAHKYRAYADRWTRPVEKPAWLSDAPGVRFVFMKHQTGHIYLRYPDLVAIWRELEEAGLSDVPLFVFSWFKAGHDAGYPIYEPDPEMGGRAALVEALRTIREEGGRVVLYTQGTLIDRSTAYYRDGPGWEVAAKNRDGYPYIDEYSFHEEGTIYPCKIFAFGCPSSLAWEGELNRLMDEIMELGASGILYDMLGGSIAHLCFDENHGHASPALAYSVKRELLQRLQKRAAERDPDFGLMVEIHADAFSHFVDLTHSHPYAQDGGMHDTPLLEMYRYTFPEHGSTSRAALTSDRVKYSFVVGLALEYPGYLGHRIRRYEPGVVEQIAALLHLRSRLRRYLIEGRFVDTDGVTVSPPSVMAKVYLAADGEGRALAIWNRELRPVRASIQVQGRFSTWQIYHVDGSMQNAGIQDSCVQDARLVLDLDAGQVIVALI